MHRPMKTILVLIVFLEAVARSAERPNLIFILSDDLSAEKPELVAKARAIMTEAHVDIPEWPMVANQKQRTEARRNSSLVK